MAGEYPGTSSGVALLRLTCFILLGVTLAACAGGGPPPVENNNLYKPPAALVTSTSLPAAQPSPSAAANAVFHPSPTPACSDNLSFIEDLTIPDGTQVVPGEVIDKRWQVENSGTCNWDNTYHLQLIAGPDLGAPAEQALYPARSGTQVPVRILFTAPDVPGTYRSAWQAYDPQGDAFGDPFFVEIVVVPSAENP
jgi:hypothetical protein